MVIETDKPQVGVAYTLPVFLRDGDSGGGDGISEVTIYSGDEAGVRSPIELDIKGLTLDNYSKNPVVMWAHDGFGMTPSAGLPIARTLKVTEQDGGLRARFEWSADPFAQRVRAQWDAGFLRAASIGFLPQELDDPEDDDKWVRVTKADLMEWSIVSIPADPKALRSAMPHVMELAEYLGELKARGWSAPGVDLECTCTEFALSKRIHNCKFAPVQPPEPTPQPALAPEPEPVPAGRVWVMDSYVASHTNPPIAITPPEPAPPEPDLSETEGLVAQIRETLEAVHTT